MKKSFDLKSKKGYILAYSVLVMTFIVIMISTAFSMLQSTISLVKVAENNFYSDIKFSQIEEYVISGNYVKAEEETKDSGYSVYINEYNETDATISEIYVYKNDSVMLYCKKVNGLIATYVYGDKPV